jgi:hypothetical protein
MTLVCESCWSHHFESSTVATMTWIKCHTWLISYSIWHSYVNHVEVSTLKVLRSPPRLELRVILGWYLIIYTLVCETCWNHHFESYMVATMTWIKSYTWLISYNIWHSYVNHVEVITLKGLRSPSWLELRDILGWYLIIYDTRMWIMLKSSLWKFYGCHHDLN